MSKIKEDFKAIQILHLAMLVGVIAIASILSFLNMPLTAPSVDLSDIFTIISIVMTFGAIGVGTVLKGRSQQAASEIKTLEEALEHYRMDIIQRTALLEGAALISVIFMFISSNTFFLLPAALCIFLMITIRPSIEDLESTYGLSNSQIEGLR